MARKLCNKGINLKSTFNRGVRNWKLLQFLFIFALAVFIAGLIHYRSYEIIDGAVGVELVAGCDIWIISPPLQPVKTAALACPDVDLIRLWPLPVKSPWSEDWGEHNKFDDAIDA
jgi:hypothetical protein